MPDITITLLIQRDTNTDEVRGSEQQQMRGGTGRGRARAADMAVTGFLLASDSDFLPHSG